MQDYKALVDIKRAELKKAEESLLESILDVESQIMGLEQRYGLPIRELYQISNPDGTSVAQGLLTLKAQLNMKLADVYMYRI